MNSAYIALVRRGLIAVHGSLLALIWGYLTLRAFLNLQVDYDFLAYHLPFALMHVGRTSYRPLPHLMVVYEGFPPLAEWMQGLLVPATRQWVCVGGKLPWTIFWAGPTLTEYRVQACR